MSWLACKWDKSTIHHNPSVSPCLANRIFNPLFHRFLLGARCWPPHCSLLNPWVVESSQHLTRDAIDSSMAEPCPETNIAHIDAVPKVAQSVECNCELLRDWYLGILRVVVENRIVGNDFA